MKWVAVNEVEIKDLSTIKHHILSLIDTYQIFERENKYALMFCLSLYLKFDGTDSKIKSFRDSLIEWVFVTLTLIS